MVDFTAAAVVVESIDRLLIVVSEWMSGDWCAHVFVGNIC